MSYSDSNFSDPGGDPSWADDDFWAAFEVDDDYVPRVPWYRKTARVVVGLIVASMLATGALVPWSQVLGRAGHVNEVPEILALANGYVDDSPYGWLVSEVRVRDIFDNTTGAFVVTNPPDGVITIDQTGWDPDELRSTVAHEVGHLLDFAGFGNQAERRNGLGSEAWAECAAVDAGFRRTDGGIGDSPYHCTEAELDLYQISVGQLGEVCMPWGQQECQVVAPILADG